LEEREGGEGPRTSGKSRELQGGFADAPLVPDGALLVVVEQTGSPDVHRHQVGAHDQHAQPHRTTTAPSSRRRHRFSYFIFLKSISFDISSFYRRRKTISFMI
jgi:hypothetical protein